MLNDLCVGVDASLSDVVVLAGEEELSEESLGDNISLIVPSLSAVLDFTVPLDTDPRFFFGMLYLLFLILVCLIRGDFLFLSGPTLLSISFICND